MQPDSCKYSLRCDIFGTGHSVVGRIPWKSIHQWAQAASAQSTLHSTRLHRQQRKSASQFQTQSNDWQRTNSLSHPHLPSLKSLNSSFLLPCPPSSNLPSLSSFHGPNRTLNTIPVAPYNDENNFKQFVTVAGPVFDVQDRIMLWTVIWMDRMFVISSLPVLFL